MFSREELIDFILNIFLFEINLFNDILNLFDFNMQWNINISNKNEDNLLLYYEYENCDDDFFISDNENQWKSEYLNFCEKKLNYHFSNSDI